MTRFSGVIPPLCTPLDSSGAIDTRSLESLIDFQLAAGVHGLFVLGSSGEAIYLSDADRRRVVDVTSRHVAGQVPVLVGALAPTVNRVIDQVRWIAEYPVDAYVVTAPFYANLSDAETVDHFRQVATAVDRPLLAYDIPANVGRKLPLAVARELLATGIVAGLKDSSGSLAEFRVLLEQAGPERASCLLTGADVLADVALGLGADGLIPGLANVRPDLFVDLYQASGQGDADRVRQCQSAILQLVKIFGAGEPFGLGRHASELGALKHLLHTAGVIASPTVSRPLRRYPADGILALDAIIQALPQ